LDDVSGQIRGVFSPEALSKVLSSYGVGFVERKLTEAQFLMNKELRGQDPATAFNSAIQGQINSIKTRENMNGTQSNTDELLVAALNKLIALQQESTNAIKQLNSASQRGANGAGFDSYSDKAQASSTGRVPIRNP
jgi:hypothetical protein